MACWSWPGCCFLILRMEQIQSQIAEINLTTAQPSLVHSWPPAAPWCSSTSIATCNSRSRPTARRWQLALSSFAQTLEQHDQGAASAAQGARIRDLADRLERYRQAFVAITGPLIGRQSPHLAAVNQNISLASSLPNRYMLDRFDTSTRDRLALLQSVQSNLQASVGAAGRIAGRAAQRPSRPGAGQPAAVAVAPAPQQRPAGRYQPTSATDWTSQAISATIEPSRQRQPAQHYALGRPGRALGRAGAPTRSRRARSAC